MKKLLLGLFVIAGSQFFAGTTALAQWVSVAENVLPAELAISPEYPLDQTVYMIDDDRRLLISETGGSQWVVIYEAPNPQLPANALLDVVISPNFKNDNALVKVHKDGSVKLSFDRGQFWIDFPVPDGTTGIAFSPNVAEDYKIFCITGAFGPVEFHRSVNGGTTWSKVADITLGGGYYCRLWNCPDTAAMNYFAVQTDPKTLMISKDGGMTWEVSFEAETSVQDFAFSPAFSQDQTMFVADVDAIWKNTSSGLEADWVNKQSFTGTTGMRFAISPTYSQDKTLFAAVGNAGILRTIDGGESFSDFGDGFLSTLPVSIAISQAQPCVLFSGTQSAGSTPGRLYKYQTALGYPEGEVPASSLLSSSPNPFRISTVISFILNETGPVTLAVYDSGGRRMALILDELLEKGFHQVNFNAADHHLKPGIYQCILKSGMQRRSKKILVVP